MFKRTIFIVCMAAAVIVALIGCSKQSRQTDASVAASSSDATTIKIQMNEFSFSEKELTVKQGEKVHFVLSNTGNYSHDINNEELKLDKDVAAGKTESFDWTAPQQAGTYQIICDKPGHKAQGMTMTLTIK